MLSTALLLLVLPGWAGSISVAGYTAGPDSNAAQPNGAAAHFNPAALAATTGFTALADVQYSFIRINYDCTRNDGIDPNTDAPYATSKARVQVPNALLGFSWKVVPNRLAVGLAVTDAFVGGGDYRAGEPDNEPPWEGSQRYAGVMSKLITLHVIPAVGLTVVDGVHVGGGLKVLYDSIEAIQASDPLGVEGLYVDGPYSADTYLEIQASGAHLGWNAGLLVDRWSKARVGASFAWNGTFETSGTGSVDAPALIGGGNPDALVTFTAPLPPVAMLWIDSQVTDAFNVGLGAELQMWGACCGGPEGDIVIGVKSTDGDALGVDPEDGLAIQVDEVLYSPRRLHNSVNLATAAGLKLGSHLWTGARVGVQQPAVPDYAVSATNLDFPSLGVQVAGRYLAGPMSLGLSYSHFFLVEREITDSAWDVRDQDSPDYVDDRFSPVFPYKASANGTYKGAVDAVGVRVEGRF